MSDIAIRVENLGKKYTLGDQKSAVSTGGSFRESISQLFKRSGQSSSLAGNRYHLSSSAPPSIPIGGRDRGVELPEWNFRSGTPFRNVTQKDDYHRTYRQPLIRHLTTVDAACGMEELDVAVWSREKQFFGIICHY